jgi:epoxyqueuosine reductase
MSGSSKSGGTIEHQLRELLDSELSRLGLTHYGMAPLTRPLSFDLYREWLDAGMHGDMQYLVDHAPIKEEPRRQWPRVQSALVFAMPYHPHPAPVDNWPLQQARVSLYAQGADYHFWFRDRLREIAALLQQHFPTEEFLCFTDSSPVLERDLARRAGIGWVGKNTCIIHPQKGSLYFLGEIYSSLSLQPNPVPLMPDYCGSCTRCLDICPTGAIVEPRKLDARRCISYLNIESRKLASLDLRAGIGDWLFGCDLCQTVCPWNQKLFNQTLETALSLPLGRDEEQALITDLRYLLTASGKRLEKDFHGTPLARAGSFGLKRNALVVIGNRRLSALHNDVAALTSHDRLGELAQWALTQLTVPD